MAYMKLLFHAAAREKLLKGAQALADAVRVTLGPRSIIDPTKVVRVALGNAVSVAGTLLLTEATMAEVTEDEDRPPRRSGEEFV